MSSTAGRTLRPSEISDYAKGRLGPKGEGCWEWDGYLDPAGYGRIGMAGTQWLVHRVSWVMAGRRLSPGKVIDHTCRNRACYRPEHLRQVSQRENSDGGFAGANRRKTHCPQGHPYEGHNLIESGGRRYCRSCMYERNKRSAP